MTYGGLNPPPQNVPVRSVALTPGITPGSTLLTFANQVIVFGPSGTPVGVFIYQAGTTPGPGNPPVISLTESTKDPYGNTVQPGVVSYSAGTSALVQLLNNNLNFTDTAGNQWQVSAGLSGGTPYLTMGGLASPLVWLTQNGGLLATHSLGPPIPETWQTPSLGTGWATGSATAGQQPARFRKAVDDGIIEIIGVVHTTSATPAATIWTMPAGYFNGTSAQMLPCTFNNNAGAILGARLNIDTAGAVSLTLVPTATSQDLHISTRFPLS